MKNFLPKTKENYPRSSRKKTFLGYAVIIAVALLVLTFGKGVLGFAASYATAPFFIARHYLMETRGTVPAFVQGRVELLTQIRTLEQKVSSREGMDATLAYLTEENRELRALLNASSSPRIVAGVIARPPFTPYDSIILDKGSADGVVEHAPVYHAGGIAIGYVRSVFPGSSLVTLFSSPGVESTVYVFGPNLFTTAYGEGGGIIRLSVPQGVAIEKGNAVVLPSLEGGALGTIDDIRSVPTEPEQHAYIALGAPIQSIRLVTVGTRAVEPVAYEEAVAGVNDIERTLFTFTVPEHATTTPIISTSTATTAGALPIESYENP